LGVLAIEVTLFDKHLGTAGAVVLDAETAPLDKLHTAKLRSGAVSISDGSTPVPVRRVN
jgi:hypothetical protein